MTLSPQQVTARTRRIGSTDISSIVAFYVPSLAHLAKYANATDTYLRLVHGLSQPRNKPMDRGNRVEPMLRTLYRETVGPVAEPPGTLHHPTLDWAVASPDGLTPSVVVELKTASIWIREQWGLPGSDKTPDKYSLQVQWLMEVAQREAAHVLVAFGKDAEDADGNHEFYVSETAAYLVPRNAELAAQMVAFGQRFMNEHVLPCVPPAELPPVHNRREFKRLYGNGKTLVGVEVG